MALVCGKSLPQDWKRRLDACQVVACVIANGDGWGGRAGAGDPMEMGCRVSDV
jgi:hypothetical protein